MKGHKGDSDLDLGCKDATEFIRRKCPLLAFMKVRASCLSCPFIACLEPEGEVKSGNSWKREMVKV